MAIQLLKFRKFQNGTYRAVIWIDDTKTVNGQPDPAYLDVFNLAASPQGVTESAYLTQMKQEIKRLVQEQTARMSDEGTALPGEGQPL